jgi:hypothetical protein
MFAMKLEKKRFVDTFAFAFMVNLLPPEVRTKVLEQKPVNISDTFTKIKEVRRMILDEKRPLNSSPGQIHTTDSAFDSLVNEVKMIKNRMDGAASQQNQTNNNRHNNNNGNPTATRRAMARWTASRR